MWQQHAHAGRAERSYVLQVAGQPLGANETRGLHWARVAKDRALFRDAFALLARAEHHGPPLAKALVQATLVRLPNQQPLDPDNAFSRLKGPLDGLVAGGLLADDSLLHVTLTLRQEKGPQRAVRLEITEV